MTRRGPGKVDVGVLPVVLAAAVGVAVLTAAMARRRSVYPAERDVFRAVNGLPHVLTVPITVVMQAGSFAAVFVTAGLATLTGRRRLAITSAAVGTAVWAGCKVVKHWVGRGRPTGQIEAPTIRGAPARGLGFPSGHAAVSVTLAGLVAPSLPASARPAVWVVAGTVAVARVYVGAHLPLDVVGGAALGLTAASAARLWLGELV